MQLISMLLQWDHCLSTLMIRSALGASFGVIFSVLLFKRRSWPVWAGLGFGAGRAWEECDSVCVPLYIASSDINLDGARSGGHLCDVENVWRSIASSSASEHHFADDDDFTEFQTSNGTLTRWTPRPQTMSCWTSTINFTSSWTLHYTWRLWICILKSLQWARGSARPRNLYAHVY